MNCRVGAGCIAGFMLLMSQTEALAQASIASENIIDTVSFSYTDATGTKQKEDVTLVRDEREVKQWYYVPSKPVLVTTYVGGRAIPQFSLLTYDYKDPGSQNIASAGLLNFSARLSLPPEAIEAMLAAAKVVVAEKHGAAIASNIRIAALPINKATVAVYAGDGKLVGTAEGTGTAPTFASQTMAFSIPLTQLGAAVLDDLVKGTAGVRTAVAFSYNGITPKCGYRITADYSRARDFYSKNEKIAARASYYGWFSGSYSKETTDIRDALIQEGALKTEILASNECSPERLDALMLPILKRINDQVLATFKPPEKIDPAVAGTPSTGGYFGGVGYSVAVKKVTELTTLKEVINFEQSTIVERNTVAQGFIGIGNYSEDIRKQLVTMVDGSINPGVYLALPQVPDGIERVDMTVSLRAGEKTYASSPFQYTRATNVWKNLQTGASTERISFSTKGVEQQLGKAAIEDAQLRINKVLRTTQQESVNIVDDAKVSDAAMALDLQRGLYGVRLSPSAVSFSELGGEFARVQVVAKVGEKSKSYVFRAFNANGAWQVPPDDYFFVPSKNLPVSLTVVAVYKNQSPDITKTVIIPVDGMRDVFLDSVLRAP